MKRFLWAAPLLFVLFSSGAWADSVNIFLSPAEGFGGDNFGIEQQSSGMTVILSGATGALENTGYVPGSTLGGLSTVYLDGGIALINGVYYNLNPNLGPGVLFMSSITLPTNGFSTVTVPVVLSGGGSATIAGTGQTISVFGTSTGTITFVKNGYNGLYYAGSFTTVPEPNTLGLIGTGLIGIFSVARRRLRIRPIFDNC